MGYSTSFTGGIKFSRVLTVTEFNYLKNFNEKRHDLDKGAPGAWCQWVSNEAGTELVWDGGEKFYGYVPWLKWLIDNYFAKQSITLNGDIRWEGEDNEDVGTIHVKNNVVTPEELQLVGAVTCPNCDHKFVPEGKIEQ